MIFSHRVIVALFLSLVDCPPVRPCQRLTRANVVWPCLVCLAEMNAVNFVRHCWNFHTIKIPRPMKDAVRILYHQNTVASCQCDPSHHFWRVLSSRLWWPRPWRKNPVLSSCCPRARWSRQGYGCSIYLNRFAFESKLEQTLSRSPRLYWRTTPTVLASFLRSFVRWQAFWGLGRTAQSFR